MRRADWVSRLWQTIETHEHVPFEVGKFDCAIFAGRCVDAITGSALTEALGYANKREAIKVLRQEGGLESAVTHRLGVPILGHCARRGDVCMIDKKTLGVCVGSTVAVIADNGIVFYPLNRAIKHWRVD